jgi:hypothetical protein
VTVAPETVRLDAVREPDADFDALREQALGELAVTQVRAARPWTDHNAADPGITLLEATLWALADLHYRVSERDWEAWPAEASAWRDLSLARGETARAALAATLADPSDAAQARRVAAASPSRARAELDLRAALGLSAAEAAAVVRLVREPRLLLAAFDRSDVLAEAVADAATPGDAPTAARGALGDLEIHEDEVGQLVAHVVRTRLATFLAEHGDDLRAVVNAAADEANALAALGTSSLLPEGAPALGPAERRIALALHPAPPTTPELWEASDGATELWPPHPIQARTCEPVTGADYARLAVTAPDVRRAWVVPGLALGVAWDGRDQAALPARRGALTLLVEPGGSPPPALKLVGTSLAGAERTRLRQLLRDALGFAGATAEVDDPFPDYRDDLDAPGPRRLLGDEVAAALLTALPVVVSGVLELVPTAREADVLDEAELLLDAFLSSDRVAPFEAPPEPPPALRVPEEIDGPWPRGEAVRDFIRSPEGRLPSGWAPGAPVRASEVVQLLTLIPGVAGVANLELAADAAAPAWTSGDLEVPPYSVPSYARHCLCTRIFDPRECGV